MQTDTEAPEETESSQDPIVEQTSPEEAPNEDLVQKLKNEISEYQDKYIRAVAELENVKKRNAKERSDLIRYAGESLARDLLDVVDSLQLAAKQDSAASTEQMLQGIKLIVDQFIGILDRHSIKGESAVGSQFDPNKHEALVSQPTDKHSEGTVIEELKRAYFFRDKLLRPAQVVVAKSPDVDKNGE